MTAFEIFNLIHASLFIALNASIIYGIYRYCKNTPDCYEEKF